MLELSVDIQDQVSARLRDFGKRAKAMQVGIARTLGNAFRKYIRQNYLSGQMLRRRTGRLRSHTKVLRPKGTDVIRIVPYMKLANIYHHPGGAVVEPKNASILRWEDRQGEVHFSRSSHIPERPFMTDAFRTFNWSAETDKAADKIIEKEIQKRLQGGR